MHRRELLKMAPLAAAGALFNPSALDWVLRTGLRASDAVSQLTFRPSALAPTFADREVTPLDRYPINSYLADDPEVDLDEWRLEVSGLVRRSGDYTLDDLRRLTRIVQNTRHLCIEGWDVIGNYGGVRVGEVLDYVGADPQARYLEMMCADDYYETIDMASARHPQSMFCYEMYGEPLTRAHGAPLRLVMPTKLGYKQAKYIVSLRVTSVLPARRGYWEDRGYGWYGGL
jgi:DMSO/TMAO reductase YedYZ molybdopterin-dependent catalytic subunit